jgi:DNA helicase-4
MLAHFRVDWDRISEGGYDLAMDEFLAGRRSLPRETLAGETVKSFGERLIANGLFEHDVRYAYERSVRWNGINYRPDFTIPTATGGVVVEYFGLEGEPDYDEMSAKKREFWAGRPGWTLLEYSPRDIPARGPEFLVQRMLGDLHALGISHRRKSEEEIWQEVRQRAIDHFTKTVRNFVGRCRKRNLSPPALATLVGAHRPASMAEQLFLEVTQSVYAAYLGRLSNGGKDDFDGWMWRASAAVREGHTRFARDHGKEHGDLARLRYVLVDEFQDFSEQFYLLLQGIRVASPSVEFFCVGDDWQAINGFAGADLRYFRQFNTLFRSSIEREITTNYRSVPAVVRAGNDLMHGLGSPAKASGPDERTASVRVGELNAFTPSAIEQERHQGDELTPAVLRLVRFYLDRGLSVTLLSRRNNVSGYVRYRQSSRQIRDGLERFLDHLRSFLPEADRERVTIRTAHRSKGLEDHAVVILDANEGSYPLIHPSWVFMRVFGDSLEEIEAAERRLFYVAVTRARTNLVILTDMRRVSRYLQDLERSGRLSRLSWPNLPPVAAEGSPLLEIRVHGYAVRDRLKDLQYRYEWSGQYWWKTAPAEGFSLEGLLGQAWVGDAARITVLTEVGDVLHDVVPAAGPPARTAL